MGLYLVTLLEQNLKYFKNTELARLYNVSEKAVRNWIDATKQGKLELQLYKGENRSYIAHTTKNVSLIEELVAKGQKYKNSRSHKLLTPAPKFYQLYNSNQILDIISSLNIRRELPLQYNYLNSGADDWDRYAQRLAEEEASNMLITCRELLETNFDSLDRLVGEHKRVNLIDIGIGNCVPVRGLVEHFVKKGALNRYVGIDISKSMLDIAEANMHEWFGDAAKFEFYERDISHDEFSDLLAYDYFGKEEEVPLNIILLLGGTIANFEVPDDILRTINRAMQPDDIFVCSLKLDTPNSRQYFDLDPDPTVVHRMASWHRLVLDLLNVDESLYDLEQVFDEEKKARFIGAKLKMDISIKFKLNKGEHTIRLRKGETILVLRYWHLNATGVVELFEKNGFEILQASKSRNHEYILTIGETRNGVVIKK